MLKKIMIIFALAAMLTSMAVTTVEAAKIAYVDLKSSVENTKAHQAGQQRLAALKSKKLEEIQALKLEMDRAEKEMLANSMAAAPQDLLDKQMALKDLRKKYMRKQQDAQEEIADVKHIIDLKESSEFYQVVRDYGKKNGYDLILPKSNAIYAGPALDVTDDITKQLDQR